MCLRLVRVSRSTCMTTTSIYPRRYLTLELFRIYLGRILYQAWAERLESGRKGWVVFVNVPNRYQFEPGKQYIKKPPRSSWIMFGSTRQPPFACCWIFRNADKVSVKVLARLQKTWLPSSGAYWFARSWKELDPDGSQKQNVRAEMTGCFETVNMRSY